MVFHNFAYTNLSDNYASEINPHIIKTPFSASYNIYKQKLLENSDGYSPTEAERQELEHGFNHGSWHDFRMRPQCAIFA